MRTWERKVPWNARDKAVRVRVIYVSIMMKTVVAVNAQEKADDEFG